MLFQSLGIISRPWKEKAGTGVHRGKAPRILLAGGGMHLLGRVAAGWVLSAAGISPSRLEMHLERAGGSPRPCPCRAVVQWDGLWPLGCLMLMSLVAVLWWLRAGVSALYPKYWLAAARHIGGEEAAALGRA